MLNIDKETTVNGQNENINQNQTENSANNRDIDAIVAQNPYAKNQNNNTQNSNFQMGNQMNQNPYAQNPNPQMGNQMNQNPYAQNTQNNTLTSKVNNLFDSVDTADFVKGALIGAGVTYLLTNENVQKTLFKMAVKGSEMLQAGVEEVKERYEDAKAELDAENS